MQTMNRRSSPRGYLHRLMPLVLLLAVAPAHAETSTTVHYVAIMGGTGAVCEPLDPHPGGTCAEVPPATQGGTVLITVHDDSVSHVAFTVDFAPCADDCATFEGCDSLTLDVPTDADVMSVAIHGFYGYPGLSPENACAPAAGDGTAGTITTAFSPPA